MKFKKQDLSFLELYNICSDTKDVNNNKVYIKAEGEKIYFAQYSNDIKLITVFDNIEKESFEIIYSTKQLSSLLKECKEDEEITITGSDISFGNNSSYNLETFETEIDDPESFLEIENREYEQINAVQDFQKSSKVSKFIGDMDGLDAISLQNNHFVAYNGTVVATSDTNNNIEDIFYFSPDMVKISQLFKFDNIKLKKYQGGEFYGFILGNTHLFLEIKNYQIPYIYDTAIQEELNHNFKAIIKREDFISSLRRIKIITNSNLEKRLYIKFSGNKVILESKDEQKGYEEISASYAPELEDFYIIVNSIHLSSIIESLKGEEIYIYLTPNFETLSTIHISDEEGDCSFYSRIYDYVEYED